jgi:hypothetical protein
MNGSVVVRLATVGHNLFNIGPGKLRWIAIRVLFLLNFLKPAKSILHRAMYMTKATL